MKHVNAIALALGLAALLTTGTASAHIKLKMPMPQMTNNPLKVEPCGSSGSNRGTTKNMFMAGQKITVSWDETIQHPGHYRIAFDDDGQDFPDPMSFEDIGMEGKDLGMGVRILADGIKDQTSRAYTAEVTLPDIECANCTLQLIQVMTDKQPYGNGDDIYHECANLVLTKAAGGAAGSGAAGAAAGAGGAAAGATGGAAGAPAAGSAAVAGSGAAASSAAGRGAAGAAPGAAGSVGMMMGTQTVAGSTGATVSGAAGAKSTSAAGAGTVAGSAAPVANGPIDPGPSGTAESSCTVQNVGASTASSWAVLMAAAIAAFSVRRRRRR